MTEKVDEKGYASDEYVEKIKRWLKESEARRRAEGRELGIEELSFKHAGLDEPTEDNPAP